MWLPASSISTFIPALASSIAAQPPQAPEPTTIASYVAAMRVSSYCVVFRVSAGREARVVRVALVFQRADHAGARSIKRERVLLFDQTVRAVGRVGSRTVTLGLGHGLHQGRAPFGIGGVEAGLLQRLHGVAPAVLGLRSVAGGLHQKVDVVGAAGFARARSVVGGDEDFGEGLQRFKIVRCEELRLVVAQQRRFGRRRGSGGARAVLVFLSGPKPGSEKLRGARQGGSAHGQIHEFAASWQHPKYYIPGGSKVHGLRSTRVSCTLES